VWPRARAGGRGTQRRHVKRETPVLAAFAALFLCAFAYGAEKVRLADIVFDGLARLGRAQMLLTVGLRIGESYTEAELKAQIEADIERLYRTEEFESVGPFDACRIETADGGTRVTFPVVEKKRVATVLIQGGKPVGGDDFAKNLRTGRGKLVSPGDIRQDREMLLRRCAVKGYFFAEVDAVLDPMPQGAIKVTFVVSPGPCVRIHRITFVGAARAEAGELWEQMENQERDFWLFGLLRSGYFSSQKIESDVKQIRAYLRSEKGLLNATAGVEEIAFDPDREAMYLTIRVEEGPVHVLKGFDIATESAPGKDAHFTADRLIVQTKAERLIGQPYHGTALRNVTNKIVSMYREDGYLNCRVNLREPRVELEGTEATAIVRIEERDRVYARRIDIRGNYKSKDEVIRRELAFAPGDLVTQTKLQKSVSNLHELQLFTPASVDIRPIESTATAEGTDFLVQAEDGNDGQMLMGIGMASDLGVIGSFALRKRNFDIFDWPSSFADIPRSFTGDGQILALELQPGDRYSHYRLSFTEPYLVNRWYGLTLSGSRDISRRDTWDNSNWGGDVRLNRYFTFERDIFATLAYRYDYIDIGRIDVDAPEDAYDVEGVTRVSALSVGLTLNKYLFDPYAGPYKGYRVWANYEYAGGFLGAHVDQWKAQAGAAYFLPVYEHEDGTRHIVMASGTFGWMETHHNTAEVPIFERFFLGGPHTLRGFRSYGVGPHENGEEIGGTALVHGTVEYTFPLFVNFLRGVTFFDWGQLEGPYRDGGVQKWDNHRLTMSRMRTAAGAGLRISLMPLGMTVPISLYWGEVIDSMPDDREHSFLFSIGSIGF